MSTTPKITASKPISAQDLEITNPHGVQSVYANDFNLGFTLTDARLIFCEIGSDPTSPTKVIRANVVVPLKLFEAMVQNLPRALEIHKNTAESEAQRNATAAANAQPTKSV